MSYGAVLATDAFVSTSKRPVPQVHASASVGNPSPMASEGGYLRVDFKRAIVTQVFLKIARALLRHALMKLDIGVFAHPINPDEQVTCLRFKADFGDVDMHKPDFIILEFLLFTFAVFVFPRQPVQAVSFHATMYIRAWKCRDLCSERYEYVIQRKLCYAPAFTYHLLLLLCQNA